VLRARAGRAGATGVARRAIFRAGSAFLVIEALYDLIFTL